MISDQIRRGIKIACINENTSVVGACKQSGISKSAIYRFMQGGNDIKVLKLDTFCRLGLNRSLMDVLELGK